MQLDKIYEANHSVKTMCGSIDGVLSYGLNRKNAEGISEMIHSLANDFSLLVGMEKGLCLEITASGRSDDGIIAKRLLAGVDRLFLKFSAYAAAYDSADKIFENQRNFPPVTHILLQAIADRMELEKQELYPLAAEKD